MFISILIKSESSTLIFRSNIFYQKEVVKFTSLNTANIISTSGTDLPDFNNMHHVYFLYTKCVQNFCVGSNFFKLLPKLPCISAGTIMESFAKTVDGYNYFCIL